MVAGQITDVQQPMAQVMDAIPPQGGYNSELRPARLLPASPALPRLSVPVYLQPRPWDAGHRGRDLPVSVAPSSVSGY